MPNRLVGTTETSAAGTSTANYVYGALFTAVATDTSHTFRVYANASGNIKVALYGSLAVPPYVGSRLAYDDNSHAVTAGWNTISFSGASITASTDFYLCVAQDTANLVTTKSTAGKTTRRNSITFSSFTWPSSLTLGLYSADTECLFAIYDNAAPTITDCEDEDIGEDETGVILDGTNLSGITVALELGNASSYGSCTVKSTQIINSNSGTQIDFDVVPGALSYGTNWLYVTSDGSTSAGYQINLHQAYPVISDVSPSTISTGESVTITGSNFGAVKSSSDVELCPAASLSGGVEQSIISWSDTEIQILVIKGTVQLGTRYLVVRRNQISDLSEEYDSNFYSVTLDKAQIVSYKQLCENGGGRFAHLWHVAGYPWAITDDAGLITALANYGADATVQAARKRLFGENTWTGGGAGTVTPAYTVPIFPGLIVDCNVSWRLNEAGGIIDGGNWSVKIEDRILGHEWKHAVDADEIWGLEGLHRVANLQDSLVNGWGWIGEKLLRNSGGYTPSQINVEEQSSGGSILYDRVDALTGDDWVALWINHECIAVDGVTGTAPNYDLDMVDYGNLDSARGLYRSRPQDHFRGRLAGLNPVIADVPGDVIGHYCWLYTIPLTDAGALRLTPDGAPMIVEELGGVISPNISTENSITTIPIRDKTAAVEHLITLEASEAVETNLRGFVFTRGDSPSASDDLWSIQKRWQQPHLTICEFAYDFEETMTDLYRGRFGDAFLKFGDIWTGASWSYDVEFWKERYIWLCDRNSTITFETVQEVIDALNHELALCKMGAPSHSESTRLTHTYYISKNNSGYCLGEFINTPASEKYVYVYNNLISYITGPLAWVFNLGTLCNENENIYTEFKKANQMPAWSHMETCAMDSVLPLEVASSNKLRYWMRANKDKEYSKGNVQTEVQAYPNYYISYPWLDKAAIIPDRIDPLPTEDTPIYAGNYLPPASEYDGEYKFYLRNETSVDDWAEGEVFSLGLPGENRRGPVLIGNIDTISASSIFDLKEVVPDASLSFSPVDNIPNIGYSLFYLPLLDGDIDPHGFSKGLSAESSSLSGIFRSLLGESVSGISIAKEIQLSWCPFFTDTDNHISSIDWQSLDNLNSLSSEYKIPKKQITDNIFDILKHELLYHAATMTREFDHDDLMWKFRFRNIGGINSSYAKSSGLKLLEGKSLPGAPSENHGIGDIYNAIKFADSGYLITNYGSTFVGFTSKRVLEVKPSISVLPGLFQFLFIDHLTNFYIEMLSALSSPTVEQQKGTTLAQSLFPVGREIQVTDTTAHRPFTHSLGLDLEPALVIATSFNYSKNSGTITYRVGGSRGQGSATNGYAPACWLRSGNFSKSVGEWSGQPNDHEFSDLFSQPKDVYFFDCFDLTDRNHPVPRTDCSCGDYSVLAIEVDTYNWTPLQFTCSVDEDSDTITLTGDTTDIDESKDYMIVFDEWDNLEDCQKVWITHADDGNTIGSAGIAASRWT